MTDAQIEILGRSFESSAIQTGASLYRGMPAGDDQSKARMAFKTFVETIECNDIRSVGQTLVKHINIQHLGHPAAVLYTLFQIFSTQHPEQSNELATGFIIWGFVAVGSSIKVFRDLHENCLKQVLTAE